MGQPLFYIQIVHVDDGRVARIPGGGDLEQALVDLCVQHVISRGVGLFRSEKHVEQDIRDGIHAALMSLKEQTRFII